MTSLSEYVRSITSSSELSFEDIRTLLSYPLDCTRLEFPISDTDLDEFYSVSLYRLVRHIFSRHKHVQYRDLMNYATLHAKSDVIFEFLTDQLCSNKDKSLSNAVVTLLEDFLFKFNRFTDLLTCWNSSICSFGHTKAIERRVRSLVSLPSRCANSLQGNPDLALLDRCAFVRQILSVSTDENFNSDTYGQIFGFIVSQLALSGYAEECASFLLLQTQKYRESSSQSFFWSDVLRFLRPDSMEVILLSILRQSKHPRMVALLFSGSLSASKTDIRTVYIQLFRRFIFVRYFPNGWLLRNIFGSLAEIVLNYCGDSDQQSLFNLVNDNLGLPLLHLWADATSIQRTAVDQRVYVSQALISWMTDFCNPIAASSSLKTSDSALLPDVLSGISTHLSSPRREIQVIGMAVGEWLMGLIELPSNSKLQEPLKFAYEETDEVKKIRPYFDALPPFSADDANTPSQATAINQCPVIPDSSITCTENLESTLDSDDDPDESTPRFGKLPQRPSRPKALSSVLYEARRKPKYLRECLDGMLLRKPEDTYTSRLCFESVTSLIYAHPQSARELVSDLVHVLVHVESPACPDEGKIMANRHSALIALGTVAPDKCARSLTHEFYQPTCSLPQRLNIIKAITDIACKLSCETPLVDTKHTVDRRIAMTPKLETTQTRRFCSPAAPRPQSVNQFAKVAGDFFFPLLRSIPQLYSSSQTGLFAHQDAGLLTNLVSSLATIYACSRGSTRQLSMATELIDLLQTVYRHSEPAVRFAVLMAMGSVITSTPAGIISGNPELFGGSSLALELHSEAKLNTRSLPVWLKRCSTNDTDPECQLLATAGLDALCDRIREVSCT